MLSVAPAYNPSLAPQIRRFWIPVLLVFGVSLVGLYIHSGHFVARNVYFQNQLVGGFTRAQVTPVVEATMARLQSKVFQIQAESDEFTLTPSQLGISFDVPQTVDELFSKGRSLWLKAQVVSFTASDLPFKRVEPALQMDLKKVRSTLLQVLAKAERPAQEAHLVWSGTGWTIAPAVPGRQVLKDEAERIIPAIVKNLSQPEAQSIRYVVHTQPVLPQIQAADLTGMLDRVTVLTKAPILVQALGKDIGSVDLPTSPQSWVQFDYAAKTVSLNPVEAQAYAVELASHLDQVPGEVTLKAVEDVPSEYSGGTYKKAVIEGNLHPGRKLDQTQLAVNLEAAFLTPDQRKVQVSLQKLPPKIHSQVAGFEFPGLVSVGQSSFHLGNHANRIHNIKRALEFEDLTVIPAGATFSYNEVLGWVSYAKGYVDGQAIFGNSLANVPGGGICQTSTTMFRAAVNGGLPIVERTNHSWDVHYYQDWHGVDSTVYPPGKTDLKFVNDTPGPLLVHSYAEDETEMAYFELYGTPDGRRVTFNTVQNVRVGRGRKIVTAQEITRPDGAIEKREIVSIYKR